MRRGLALGAAAMLVTIAMAFTASPVGADAPSQQGWWVATNPGGLPSAPARPTSPPDVPPDGLLIEGGPNASSPTAYAALVYDVPNGATVGSLTLSVAPSSGTTPQTSLQVCPLQNPSLKAEQGGPMADAPAYSTHGCVTAGPGANATTYTFNVSALLVAGSVAVAILPTTPTDRVVLSKPADDSLPVRTAPSTTSGSSGSGSFDSGGSGSFGGTSSGSADSFPGGSSFGNTSSLPASSGALVSPTPAAPAVAAPAAPAPAAPRTAPAPATARPRSVALAAGPPGPAPAKPWAIALLVAAAAIGAIMWTAAGRAARRAVRTQEV